jgi:hypothetical protein
MVGTGVGVIMLTVNTDCSTQPSLLFQRMRTHVEVPIFLISGMTWTIRPLLMMESTSPAAGSVRSLAPPNVDALMTA